MANKYAQRIYDAALKLKDAGLVCTTATSENGTVILDLGEGLVCGDLVVDIVAVETGNTDEKFVLALEGSTVAAMTSTSVTLAAKNFGQPTAPQDQAVTAAGRYIIPFRNEEAGTLYRYVRYQITGTGTIGTGINFAAFITKCC